MYLQKVIYQMHAQIESLIPCFHRSHQRNLALMVVGMVYARSVNLPQIASCAPLGETQLEARVQRFERVLRCPKLIALEVLRPVAARVLQSVHDGSSPLMILMDRSMINDRLNLLWIAVGYHGRAIPLGWVRVPHDGASDLSLQQQLLSWLKKILPRGARAVIVADREFQSIHLAKWLDETLKLDYVLRTKAGSFVQLAGDESPAGQWASRGASVQLNEVKVTKERRLSYRTQVTMHWEAAHEEPWILVTNLNKEQSVLMYRKRFWIEEMFSDHKSRGLNLEQTRLLEADRLQRLLIAVTLAYIWLMELGGCVVVQGKTKKVDNKGARRSISLCQIGLRWLRELLNNGWLPPPLTINFGLVGKT